MHEHRELDAMTSYNLPRYSTPNASNSVTGPCTGRALIAMKRISPQAKEKRLTNK